VQVLDVDLTWRMHKVSDGQRRRVQICMGLLRPYQVCMSTTPHNNFFVNRVTQSVVTRQSKCHCKGGKGFQFLYDDILRRLDLKSTTVYQLVELLNLHYIILWSEAETTLFVVPFGQEKWTECDFFCGKVLLLDEITVDLDVLARADLLAFLKSECEERGATIIYATHIFDGLDSWPSHLVMFSLQLTPRLLALHAEVTFLIFILFLHLSCKQTGATA